MYQKFDRMDIGHDMIPDLMWVIGDLIDQGVLFHQIKITRQPRTKSVMRVELSYLDPQESERYIHYQIWQRILECA